MGKSKRLKWARRQFVAPFERSLSRYSKIGDRPFFESTVFPWAARLETAYPVILKEIQDILARREPIPQFGDIVSNDRKMLRGTDWQAVFLRAYGRGPKRNRGRCPETMKLLDAIPGVKTAFFSILPAGQEIPLHRGPYKGVLRYHLGLVIPEPREEVGIEVGGEVAHWSEGESLVFDDSFPHRAWNRTDSERIVLFLDVARPLPFPLNLANEMMIFFIGWSSYIQDARRNQEAWDSKMEKA